MIPHSRPTLGEFDLSGAAELLASGRLARGAECARLESLFCARFLGASGHGPWRARTVSSGTAALHVGLWALSNLRESSGGRRRSEVITTALACNALIHAIRAVGARPILVDTLADGNLDTARAADRVTEETLAALVPHMYGKPVDLFPLLSRDVPIFEDCAQCLGLEGPNGRVGASAGMMMTSFYATKLICTGQGGLVATDSPALMEEISDLCELDHRDDPKPRWNLNLSDWSAQLAIPQVESYTRNLERRREIADRYSQALEQFADTLRLPDARRPHAWYRYVLLTPDSSDEWIRDLNNQGVEAKRPVHAPLHRTFGLSGDYRNAEDHWKRSLSLPIYPTLDEPEQDQVIHALARTVARLL